MEGTTVRHRRNRAFTLVELLVVISIIALLIAILLPSLKKAREQAKTVKCLANLKSMGLGISYYTQDNNDILPGPLHPPVYRVTGIQIDPNSPFRDFNQDTERPWFLLDRLAPFFAKTDSDVRFTDEVATCPTLMQQLPDERFKAGDQITNDFGLTGANPTWSRPYHYLPNSWKNTAPIYYFGWTDIGVTWKGFQNALDPGEDLYKTHRQREEQCGQTIKPGVNEYKPKSMTLIKRASDEWAIGDAWYGIAFVRPKVGPPIPKPQAAGTWQNLMRSPKDTGGSSANPLRNKPAHRDRRGTNLVFFDGHASTFTGEEPDWVDVFPGNRNALPDP